MFHSPDLCSLILQLEKLKINIYSIYYELPGSPWTTAYNLPALLLPALL